MPANMPEEFEMGEEFFPLKDANLGQLKSKVEVKKIPTGILGKTANYFKNVTKSLVGVTYKHLKDKMPEVVSFGQAMKDVASEAGGELKSLKDKISGGGSNGETVKKWIDHTKNAFSDLKKDFANAIKTGEFGKEEDVDFSKMFGDDDDWSDVGDMGGNDFGDDKEDLKSTLNANSANTTKAFKKSMAPMVGAQIKTMKGMNRSITNAVMSSTKVSLGSSAKIAQMQLAASRAQFTAHIQSQQAIYSVLNNMYSFMSTQSSKDISAAMEYRAKNLSMQEDTLNILKDLKTSIDSGFSINAAMAMPRDLPESERKKILGSGFNAQEYFKSIKSKVMSSIGNSSLGQMGSMGSMAGEMGDMMGGNPIKQMMYGALGSMPGLLLSKATKGKMGHINDIFSGMGGAVIGKMNSLSRFSNNNIIRQLAAHLGVGGAMSQMGDRGLKDPKGRAVFDNQVHRTIVEVIPGYLAKMLAATTNQEEIYYDMSKGRFKTTSSKIKEVKHELDSASTSNSLLNSAHSLMIKKGSVGSKNVGLDPVTMEKDFKQITKNIVESDQAFEPKEAQTNKTYRDFLSKGLKGGKKSLDYYIKIFHDMREGDQMAHITGTNQAISERSNIIHKINSDDTNPTAVNDYMRKYKNEIEDGEFSTMHLDTSKLTGKAKIAAERKKLEMLKNRHESGIVGTFGLSAELGGEKGGNGAFASNLSGTDTLSKIYHLLADGIIVFPRNLKNGELPGHLKNIWKEREDSKSKDLAKQQMEKDKDKFRNIDIEERIRDLKRKEYIERHASSQGGTFGAYISGHMAGFQRDNILNKGVEKGVDSLHKLTHWGLLGGTHSGGSGSDIEEENRLETEQDIQDRINASQGLTLLGSIITSTEFSDNPVIKKINEAATMLRKQTAKLKNKIDSKKEDIKDRMKDNETLQKINEKISKLKAQFDSVSKTVSTKLRSAKKFTVIASARAGRKITTAVHGNPGERMTASRVRGRKSKLYSSSGGSSSILNRSMYDKASPGATNIENNENFIPEHLRDSTYADMGSGFYSPTVATAVPLKNTDTDTDTQVKPTKTAKAVPLKNTDTDTDTQVKPTKTAMSSTGKELVLYKSIIKTDENFLKVFLDKTIKDTNTGLAKITDPDKRIKFIENKKGTADALINSLVAKIPPEMKDKATDIKNITTGFFKKLYTGIEDFDYGGALTTTKTKVKTAMSSIHAPAFNLSGIPSLKVDVETFSDKSLASLGELLGGEGYVSGSKSGKKHGLFGGLFKKKKSEESDLDENEKPVEKKKKRGLFKKKKSEESDLDENEKPVEKKKKRGLFGHIGHFGGRVTRFGAGVAVGGVKGAFGAATGFVSGFLSGGKEKVKYHGLGKLVSMVEKNKMEYDNALALVRSYLVEKKCSPEEAAKFLDEMARIKSIPYKDLDKVLMSWKNDKLISPDAYKSLKAHKKEVGSYAGGLEIKLKGGSVSMPNAGIKKKGLLHSFAGAMGSATSLIGGGVLGTGLNIVKKVFSTANRILFTAEINKALEKHDKIHGKSLLSMMKDIKSGKKTAKETLAGMSELVKEDRMSVKEMLVFSQELLKRGYMDKDEALKTIAIWSDSKIINKKEASKISKNVKEYESFTYGMKDIPDIFSKKKTQGVIGKLFETAGGLLKTGLGVAGKVGKAVLGGVKSAADHIHGFFSHGVGGLLSGHEKASGKAARKGSFNSIEQGMELKGDEKHFASMAADLKAIRHYVSKVKSFPLNKKETEYYFLHAGAKVKGANGGGGMEGMVEHGIEKEGKKELGKIGGKFLKKFGVGAVAGVAGEEAINEVSSVGGAAKTTGEVAKGAEDVAKVAKGAEDVAKVAKAGGMLAKAGGLMAKITGFIGGLFEHDPIKKFVGKEVRNKIIGTITKKLEGKALAIFAKGLLENIMKYATPIGWAIVGANFMQGMAQADRYFATGEGMQPNLPMRIVSGLLFTLSQALLGLLPVKLIAPLLYNIIASKATKEWEEKGKKFAADKAKLLGVDASKLEDYESRSWDEKLFGGDGKSAQILGFKKVEDFQQWKMKKYDPSQHLFDQLKAKYGGDKVLQEPSTPEDKKNQDAFQKEYIKELTKLIGGVKIDKTKSADNKDDKAKGVVPTTPGAAKAIPGGATKPPIGAGTAVAGAAAAGAVAAGAAGAAAATGMSTGSKPPEKIGFNQLLNPNLSAAQKAKVPGVEDKSNDKGSAVVKGSSSTLNAPSLTNAANHISKNSVNKGKLGTSPIVTDAVHQTSIVQQQLFTLNSMQTEISRHNKIVEDFMVEYSKSFSSLLHQFGAGDHIDDTKNKPSFFDMIGNLMTGKPINTAPNNQNNTKESPPAPMPSNKNLPGNYAATKESVKQALSGKNNAAIKKANAGGNSNSPDLRLTVASGA